MISNDIRHRINDKCKLTAIGNDTRSMKDVAIDLIHASGLKYKQIAHMTFLCPATVQKLAEQKTRHPRYDTIERVYRAFNYKMELRPVRIQAKYSNKEKV